MNLRNVLVWMVRFCSSVASLTALSFWAVNEKIWVGIIINTIAIITLNVIIFLATAICLEECRWPAGTPFELIYIITVLIIMSISDRLEKCESSCYVTVIFVSLAPTLMIIFGELKRQRRLSRDGLDRRLVDLASVDITPSSSGYQQADLTQPLTI